MEPAIFDTTVWIDFINGVDNRQTQLLEQTISQHPDFVLITPTILQEILQGLRTEADFNRTKTILDSFRMLSPDWPTVALEAGKERSLRILEREAGSWKIVVMSFHPIE